MTSFALLPAAGNGFRYGSPLPKQYLPLQGKPVLQHALDRVLAQFAVKRAFVVIAAYDHWFAEKISVPDNVTVLRCGGATRAESVRNALAHIDAAESRDWVLVHDAVRPCLDAAASLRLQHALVNDDVGGFLAVPVTDTVKRLGDDERVTRTEPRETLWRAQTPQLFRFGVLREAVALPANMHATDEANAVEGLGLRPLAVLGSATNVKITFPDDLLLAAAILAAEAAD
jgi:2-C-methyl-D-erythritol 4-phosphate cytidylyltransferase